MLIEKAKAISMPIGERAPRQLRKKIHKLVAAHESQMLMEMNIKGSWLTLLVLGLLQH